MSQHYRDAHCTARRRGTSVAIRPCRPGAMWVLLSDAIVSEVLRRWVASTRLSGDLCNLILPGGVVTVSHELAEWLGETPCPARPTA